MKTPIKYLKESWAIYTKKENFVFFAKVMAILVIIPSIFGYLVNYLYPVNAWEDLDFTNIPMIVGFVLLSLVSIFIGLWVQSTTLVAVLSKPTNNVKLIFSKGFKYIGKYFLASYLYGILIFLGILLLIVPGVLFSVWFAFTIFFVFDKNIKIKKALAKSKALVKGKFIKVLGRFFVFVLAIFLVQVSLTAIPYVGVLITSFVAPLFIIPFYLFYKDLSITSS